MAWTTFSFSVGQVLTAAQMNNLYANFEAVADGDSGAPRISESGLAAAVAAKLVTNGDTHNHVGGDGAKLAAGAFMDSAIAEGDISDSAITEAKLGASAVSQGKLKTALNTISGGTHAVTLTKLTGGQYCFMPTTSFTKGSSTLGQMVLSICNFVENFTNNYGIAEIDLTSDVDEFARIYTQFITNSNGTLYVRSRYISASPPYDPFGLGEHLLFVYGLVDKATGEIVLTSIAPDPIWANNGPTPVNHVARRGIAMKEALGISGIDTGDYFTKLRSLRNPSKKEKETLIAAINQSIPQSVKNADMDLIPHPWGGYDKDKYSVVLLAGDVLEDLFLMDEVGDDVASIVLKKYITFDNSNIEGAAKYLSDGLLTRARWKLTRG